jgi:hypothetical protein
MSNVREGLGLSLSVLAVALAGVLYQWLPETAGAFGRLVVAANLASPLLVIGLLVGLPLSARGSRGTRRLVLGTAITSLVMAREAARLRGTAVPPLLAVVYWGVLLLLLAALAWASWKARHPSRAASVAAR